jgi:subtilisin family serine protease
VVAVLDTGIGEHPWLTGDFVSRDVEVLGTRLGIDPRSAASELTGVGEPLLGWLDEDAGHGTFIAGLIRQRCPEARLLDIPLYGNDGVVEEAAMLRTLQLLVLRQMLAVNGNCRYEPVDVVSLSLGYYHEQPDDPDFDPLLRGPIEVLGRYGVAVVVSAGNDATKRPAFPAAFAPYDGSPYPPDPEVVPVLAVGALNPNGTIALFSNDGPWVRYMRRGASLVSTFPTTYNGSRGPEVEVETESGVRESMDPDDFSSGFGVWSGTSFAAPVLAGELAAALATQYYRNAIEPGDGADPCSAVARMRRAIASLPTRAPAAWTPAT